MTGLKWIMNWRGCGMKRSWPTLKYYPGIWMEMTEKNQESPKSGHCVFRPKFETGASAYRIEPIWSVAWNWIRKRNVLVSWQCQLRVHLQKCCQLPATALPSWCCVVDLYSYYVDLYSKHAPCLHERRLFSARPLLGLSRLMGYSVWSSLSLSTIILSSRFIG
jgi:hypothetical protein